MVTKLQAVLLRNRQVVEHAWRLIEKTVIDAAVTPDALFDMGAGQVNTEAWLCNVKWPKCKIIGTEPNDMRRKLLVEAAFPGVLLNTVVASEVGVLKGFMGMNIYPKPYSGFTINPHKSIRQFFKPSELKATTLDELDKEYGPFKNIILWADIEGSEYKMLCGAKELLKRKAIVSILVEVLSVNKHLFKLMRDMLLEYGYEYKYSCKQNPQDHIFVRA